MTKNTTHMPRGKPDLCIDSSQVEQLTKENGVEASETGRASKLGQTGLSMKEIGKTTEPMDMENLLTSMVTFMKATGSMTGSKAAAS